MEVTASGTIATTTARQLRNQGYVVSLLNLGIPTAVIGRDFERLGQQYNRTIAGNFIDQEVPFVATNSTVVTMFAGGNEVIKAQVPLAEMLSYASDLTSKTGARGSYTMEFSHYYEVPGHLADKVIANAKAGTTGEEEEEE